MGKGDDFGVAKIVGLLAHPRTSEDMASSPINKYNK